MKQKKRFLALFLALCVLAVGHSALAADLATAGDGVKFVQTTQPDGSVAPFTMYIGSTSTDLRASGSNSVTYSLNMSTSRNVKASCNVTLQRYLGNNSWTNASDTRYYENSNCNEFDVTGSVSNLPSGMYRIVVDYYAERNGYTDYVYAESGNCYL